MNFEGIRIEGHTKKEVCNGISALAYGLYSMLDNWTKEQVVMVEQDALMIITMTCKPIMVTNLIFESYLMGLMEIHDKNKQHMYPVEFVMRDEEGNETEMKVGEADESQDTDHTDVSGESEEADGTH